MSKTLDVVDEQVEPITRWKPLGTRARPSYRKAKRGRYAPNAPGSISTTRQTSILNPAMIAAPTHPRSLIVGIDTVSKAEVAWDPVTAYQNDDLESTTSVSLGDVGVGKSSNMKTNYVLRPLMLEGRRAVVIDKKPNKGEGEYAELTRFFGGEPIRLVVDGDDGTRLNLMDPVIAAAGFSANHGHRTQRRLLRAVAAASTGTLELALGQRRAVNEAYYKTMAEHEDTRVATLTDLVARLGQAAPHDIGYWHPVARDAYYQAAFEVRMIFEELLTEYSGIFEGETSPHVKLQKKLTTFDISALPNDGPLLSMVMATINGWLTGTLVNDRGWITYELIEEAWHLLEGATGLALRDNLKLQRAFGLCLALAFHKIADIKQDSPAWAIISEAQTIHILRQSRAVDVEMCEKVFDLERANAAMLPNLLPGEQLLLAGNRKEVKVRHILSEEEERLIDTDAAMFASAIGEDA